MRTFGALCAAFLLALTPAGAAFAHVTVQPEEAPAGSFFRFVVRVPNERDDAATTRVVVEFPDDLAFVSFQPKPGWTRKVTMRRLDEPIEVAGARIDEVVDTVTWSGGAIRAGEFDEFGFSARVPDDPGTIEFAADQHYSSGEVVSWSGSFDSDEPAPRVSVVDLGGSEGAGELALLASLRNRLEDLSASDGDGESPLGIVLGGSGLLAALAAMGVALRRRPG